MSGGAFGYRELHFVPLHDAIEEYLDDPDLSPKTKEYMKELMLDIRLLHERVKRLDYYLSGDSREYK